MACGNKSYKLNKEDGKVVTTFPVGGSRYGKEREGETKRRGREGEEKIRRGRVEIKRRQQELINDTSAVLEYRRTAR